MELTNDDVALLVEALQDAAFYRDTRSHVLGRAVRRKGGTPDAGAEDRAKVRAYETMALWLKGLSSDA